MKLSNHCTFLITDDHSIVRQGIAMLINELFLNPKIYKSGNFKDTFKILHETKIDLLILDINFPDGSSINIIQDIKNIQPGIKILIFTAYNEDIYALRYLNSGASGYLNKNSSEEEMKNALTTMVLTGKYITQNVKDRILDSYISKSPINPIEQLSNRELEVAKMLIKGHGNLEISDILNIKKTTVSTFKNRIFEKLEIDSLAALIELFRLYDDNE
ncbi:two component transcriptional regulator, LuxR family [Flavobacterium flevense]|uniref:DNA-binding response regulator n=1 Tax=Flavobacterium flevense TaxID=983 RepID=A0A4Y4ATN5_9FLAO|nr:response regulator transcription factor [Flavobacterium flevense]GEC71596.1 DNA-binding response regulator [Flavobacterium flevense]SHL49069.1 two component transcriptional regulator, LuxR family [Flavobacterium flevense]